MGGRDVCKQTMRMRRFVGRKTSGRAAEGIKMFSNTLPNQNNAQS